jgi:hypothetical protein
MCLVSLISICTQLVTHSLVYPQGVDGSCEHLDVLYGITPQGSSSSEETQVSISLHVQWYPSTLDDSIKNPRLVNVLVLENYTSQHDHKQVEGMINNMNFQQMGDHSKST